MIEKLTGRRRFRTIRKWGFQKLVLQVEIVWQDTDYAGGFAHTFKGRGWRDATTEDLTTTELDGDDG